MQPHHPIKELYVSKEFYFDASHSLPNYDGNCQRPHGHTYKLVVEVQRVATRGSTSLIEGGPKEGMVFDFADLKKVVKETVLDKVDHYDLNKIFTITTAEYMVLEISDWLIEAFQNYKVKVAKVSLSEICVPTESKATVKIGH